MNSDGGFHKGGATLRRSCKGGVTLIELLIVFGIMAMLAALLVPGITAARNISRIGQCQSNLRQIGMAIFSYCQHYNGCIPAVTDSPTNQVWNNAAGAPDSLGVLVTQRYLDAPRTLFCALDTCNSDQVDGARIGMPAGKAGGDAYCSYLYRQECIGTGPFHVDSLGQNPLGKVMRALALDVSCPP